MIKIVSLPCGGAFAPARRPAAGGAAAPWAGCGCLSALVSPCVAQRTAGGAFAVWAVLQRHMGRFAASYGPFCNAERPVSCCRTACVGNPLALSYFAPRGAELCVAWRQRWLRASDVRGAGWHQWGVLVPPALAKRASCKASAPIVAMPGCLRALRE